MKKRNFDVVMKPVRRFGLDKVSLPGILFVSVVAVTLFLVAGLFFTGSGKSATTALLCSLAYSPSVIGARAGTGDPASYATPTQLEAILHYATTSVVPQQTLAEVKLTYNVLRQISPCNFLVFGLGHDSLMWAGLNPRGTTVFLEEDSRWMRSVSERHRSLQAYHVSYNTQLSEANDLIGMARDKPECAPDRVQLESHSKCRLMLPGLPEEIYDKEWDVIMVDAPKGYFAEAPGRMGAIFTAAVMARRRVKPGATHVYLHDVDRKVEKMYAAEFLCMKNKVEGTGRLWHFKFPKGAGDSNPSKFCP